MAIKNGVDRGKIRRQLTCALLTKVRGGVEVHREVVATQNERIEMTVKGVMHSDG
jgi:hypothetical protein